jgi:hypothetical protein
MRAKTLKKTAVRNPQPFTPSVIEVSPRKPRRGRPRKASASAPSRRPGRQVDFEKRVQPLASKVYAKLAPFWARFGIEKAGHDEIKLQRVGLRNAAIAYADLAQKTGLAAVNDSERLPGLSGACVVAMANLDAAAMKLAAVCELNLARVEAANVVEHIIARSKVALGAKEWNRRKAERVKAQAAKKTRKPARKA